MTGRAHLQRQPEIPAAVQDRLEQLFDTYGFNRTHDAWDAQQAHGTDWQARLRAAEKALRRQAHADAQRLAKAAATDQQLADAGLAMLAPYMGDDGDVPAAMRAFMADQRRGEQQ